MKKTYEYIGTIDINEIAIITTNEYRWYEHGNTHRQSFKIYLKCGKDIEFIYDFVGIKDNPDTDEIIEIRKIYSELVNDFLKIN